MISIIFNVIILLMILILIIEILKNDKINKRKVIVILGVLLIFNTIIAYRYVEIKSNFNISTYMSYVSTRDAFSKSRYPNRIEKVEDMRKLVDAVREINGKLEVLEFHLRHSKLTRNNKRFYSIITGLKNNLNSFIKQHNNHFAMSSTFSLKQLEKYKKIKVELVVLEYYLNKLGSSQSRRLGMMNYNIGLMGKENYDWYLKLEERVSNIEKIVNAY